MPPLTRGWGNCNSSTLLSRIPEHVYGSRVISQETHTENRSSLLSKSRRIHLCLYPDCRTSENQSSILETREIVRNTVSTLARAWNRMISVALQSQRFWDRIKLTNALIGWVPIQNRQKPLTSAVCGSNSMLRIPFFLPSIMNSWISNWNLYIWRSTFPSSRVLEIIKRNTSADGHQY